MRHLVEQTTSYYRFDSAKSVSGYAREIHPFYTQDNHNAYCVFYPQTQRWYVLMHIPSVWDRIPPVATTHVIVNTLPS